MQWEKYKEPAKSVLLALLICSAMFLTCRVWIYGELMPMQKFSVGGMMEFLRSGMAGGYTTLSSNTLQAGDNHLFIPTMAQVTEDGQQQAVAVNARQLYDVHVLVRDLMISMYSGTNVKVEDDISQEEWQKAVESDGLLLDFGTSLTSGLYWEYLVENGLKKDHIPSFSFQYLCIAQDQGVYFHSSDGQTVRMALPVGTAVADVMETVQNMQQGRAQYHFAWQEESQVVEQALERGLCSDQLLPAQAVYVPVLESSNPLSGDDAPLRQEWKDKILQYFSYNPATLMYYTTATGENYVESSSILRLDYDGTVEYRTSEGKRGISILTETNSADGALSEYELVRGVYEFLSRMDATLRGGEAQLSYAGMRANGQDSITVYFRYNCEGVDIYDAAMTGVEGCPIQVKVEGGYITYLYMQVRNYTVREGRVPVLRVQAALAALPQASEGYCQRLKLYYVDDGSGTVMANYLWQEQQVG